MIQSLNTKVDLAVDATTFRGVVDYGEIRIGDKGFEFYNEHNPKKCIQIPWKEIECIIASSLFKGKWIPRYALKTKKDGIYIFISKDAKKVLRTVRNYVDPSHIFYSLSFFDVIEQSIKSIVKKN